MRHCIPVSLQNEAGMSVAMNPPNDKEFILRFPDVVFTKDTALYSNSKLWKLIYRQAHQKQPKWSVDTMSVVRARKLAYQHGFVDRHGYLLTPLGKAFTKLLE